MAITMYERRRNLGLAGGSLWLILVGVTYAAWALVNFRSALATSLLVAICIFTVGMYFFGVVTIRRVRAMAYAPSDWRSEARRIWLRFAGIVAFEVVAIAILSYVCARTHHGRFIVPLAIVIVGLHFLPLARLFRVPRYYATGALFCVISLGTMLMVPISAQIGECWSWIGIPSVGCGLVALATAWAGLNEVGRFVAVTRTQM